MPNFNTHWLVALKAISAAPEWIQKGCTAYLAAGRNLGDGVRLKLTEVATEDEARRFPDRIANLAGKLRDDLAKKAGAEALAFSAYMCGACGPDFWVLPMGKLPSVVGEHHFDLGHYNRTHQQFLVSVERLAATAKAKAPWSLAQQLEIAYFLGMATHIGADLVIHQLVNRSAGAYNLLVKSWMNEGGHAPEPLWSTHNKVEHYWDTYVRFRYLSDFGHVFPSGDGNWFGKAPACGLPVIEALQAFARGEEVRQAFAARRGGPAVLAALQDALGEDAARFALEQPLTFPQIFADRMLSGDVSGHVPPFVYKVVVDKDGGAYPRDVVPAMVADEATSSKLVRGGSPSELNKVEFFSTAQNKGYAWSSNNFLTYCVCPSLAQVREFGHDVFYASRALGPFVKRAAEQAKVFAAELLRSYQGGSPAALGKLRRFWNLDTGLGLRVVRRKVHTPKEIVTRLEFVHVVDPRFGGVEEGIKYDGEYAYVNAGQKAHSTWEHEEAKAFTTYGADPFGSLAEVSEKPDAFLERIRLRKPAPAPQSRLTVEDDVFFPKEDEPGVVKKVLSVFSSSSGKNELQAGTWAHRLNLEIKVGIARLLHDEVGFFLQGDKDGVKDDFEPASWYEPGAGSTQKWLERTRMLDHGLEGLRGPCDLRFFRTRLLANFEPSRDLARKTAVGEWNNVVPYKDSEKHYGRNFVISSARAKVLHCNLSVRRNFDARQHFDVYDDVSPTEQIFFTVHPLVRTAHGVFDVLSKKKVQAKEMKEIRRIQAVGFVKIVLYYELGPDGACQLSECYVDGERVPVELSEKD